MRLSNTASPYTNVLAGTSGLSLTGYGALPATGYTHFRLVPYGTGLALQGDKAVHWTTLKTGLPGTRELQQFAGLGAEPERRRVVHPLPRDGRRGARRRGRIDDQPGRRWTSTSRVRCRARCRPAGRSPRYAPRRSRRARTPSSAAPPPDRAATTTSATRPRASPTAGWRTTTRRATCSGPTIRTRLTGNANLVLRYQGQPVFAQYSASNGGATVDGGRPYLVGKADPYDSPASGDPYLDQSRTRQPELARRRVRVALGQLDRGHQARRVRPLGRTGGVRLRHRHELVRARPPAWRRPDRASATRWASSPTTSLVGALPATPVGADCGAGRVRLERARCVSWSPPASPGTSAVVGLPGAVRFARAASARQPRAACGSGRSTTSDAAPVWLRAINAQGDGPVATVYAPGIPRAGHVTAVTASRLFDTRSPHVPVDTTASVPVHRSRPRQRAEQRGRLGAAERQHHGRQRSRRAHHRAVRNAQPAAGRARLPAGPHDDRDRVGAADPVRNARVQPERRDTSNSPPT